MRSPFNSVSILAVLSTAIAQASVIRNLGCGNEPSAEAVLRMERDFAAKRATSGIEARGTRNPIALTIDVYFHVIRKSDSVKDGNVPDIQLINQINVLNTDYYAANLTFKLAGTTRTTNSDWFNIKNADDIGKEMKQTLRTGGPGDLNVYTVGDIKARYGFSTFPVDYSTNQAMDGVVIRSSTLPGGSDKDHNLGRILTHEVGHWVGLLHLFEGGCGGNDFVDDTPQQASKTEGCPSESDSCPGGAKDLIHNFMGLSDCMYEFSTGQIKRMREQISTYRGLPFLLFVKPF